MGPVSGTCIIFSGSLITGVCSSLMAWKVPNAMFILTGVIIICLYIINLILSLVTHKNIVDRFPTEKATSARRITLALTSQFVLLIPFAITSILYLSSESIYSIPNDICLLVTRLSIIINGFVYGHTNRRISPHFYRVFGKTVDKDSPQSKAAGPMGQVNTAFSDEVM